MELTPPEGITLYPSDEVTIELLHEWRVLRWLRFPTAKLRLMIDRDGRLHVHHVEDVAA